VHAKVLICACFFSKRTIHLLWRPTWTYFAEPACRCSWRFKVKLPLFVELTLPVMAQRLSLQLLREDGFAMLFAIGILLPSDETPGDARYPWAEMMKESASAVL
jgi:hypothetical protein